MGDRFGMEKGLSNMKLENDAFEVSQCSHAIVVAWHFDGARKSSVSSVYEGFDGGRRPG